MGDERNSQPRVYKGETMLVRIADFVFDIHKLDAIDFDNKNYVEDTICLYVNQDMYAITVLTEKEFIAIKEFFTSLAPDLNTDLGRKAFLATIQQIAKMQGFSDAVKTQKPPATNSLSQTIEETAKNFPPIKGSTTI